MQPWKTKNLLEENHIGLSKEVAVKLIHALDIHLSSLFILFHQYQKHCWMAEGPQFRDLRSFWKKSHEEVLKHAGIVAERIKTLGGIPTCHPIEQVNLSYISHEAEGEFHAGTMLELDCKHEQTVTKRLRNTINLATELKDNGTAHLLGDILFKCERRIHMLQNYLSEDSL